MVKMQAAVGEGAIGSSINSPLGQKFSLKSKNNHKTNHKNSKKAFSVAEAMIALLIGSVALGMAAPMITKQIKAQNMTDTQFRIINDRNYDLLERISELENIIEGLGTIPAGAVMYFDSATCPNGWEPLTNSRPNSKGAFIRNIGDTNTLGTYQQNAAPNISGTMENFVGGSYHSINGADNRNQLSMSGAFSNEYLPIGDHDFRSYDRGGYFEKMNINFDASQGGTTSYGRDNTTEVRPDNITLLACKRVNVN